MANAGLTYEQLNAFSDLYHSDPKNLLAQTTCCQIALVDALVDRKKRFTSSHMFNTKLSIEGKATNQKSSGRCWIFAMLNCMRLPLMKSLKVSELELSQNYLFYWDKIERCHYFLTSMIDLAKKQEPLQGRLAQFLLKDLIIDGGQWDMLVNLVKKYGVVPKSVYPESSNSEGTVNMNKLLRAKLRGYAQEIYEFINDGKRSDDELYQRELEMMSSIYHIVTTCLGTPPTTFEYEYYDSSKEYHKIGPITPLAFYEKHVKPVYNVDEKVCLVHDPRASHPYNKLYTVEYLGNIVGSRETLYNNQEISVLKKAAYDSIKADEPVWIGVDFGKHIQAKFGIMDLSILNTELFFNSTWPCQNKASRLEYGESLMTHAMVFTGVHVEKSLSLNTNQTAGQQQQQTPKPSNDSNHVSSDEQGTLNNNELARNNSDNLVCVKWRVENSHGDDKGDKGYLIMSDDWFNEYLYEVVVDKKHLSKSVLTVLDQEPIRLVAWDPMGALA